MKYYVQFMREGIMSEAGQIVDACGSDSIFILDGRNNLETMICDAYARIESLKNVQAYKYFQIRQGDLKHSRNIYQNYN